MPAEVFYGVLAFGGMFVMWVVLPSIIRQRHLTRRATDDSDGRNLPGPKANTP